MDSCDGSSQPSHSRTPASRLAITRGGASMTITAAGQISASAVANSRASRTRCAGPTEFVLEDRDDAVELRAQLDVGGAACCSASADTVGPAVLRVGGFCVVLPVGPSPNVPVPLLEPSLLLKHSSMPPVISRTSVPLRPYAVPLQGGARPRDDFRVGRGRRGPVLASSAGKSASPGRRLIARGTGAMMSAQVDIGSTCKSSFTDSHGEDGRRTGVLYVVEDRCLPSIHG